jgi:hypothetical protein
MSKLQQISRILRDTENFASGCSARFCVASTRVEFTTPWSIASERFIQSTSDDSSFIQRQVVDRVDALKKLRFLPVDIVQKKKAISLQMESLWDRHQRKIYGLGAFMVSYAVWKSMRFTASAFVNVSESLAVTGVTTLGASATFMAAVWYYRRMFTISPSAVYRMAMIRLNTHPGVLEVMGAPVVGSDVRASVLTGGGIKLFPKPKLKKKRVQMMFPLKGSERKGLVSLEAKKNRSGKLVLSLLAVDVAAAGETSSLLGKKSQTTEVDVPSYDRIYIQGGIKQYERGNVLNELRKPFLNALQTDWQEAAEVEDDAREDEIEKRKRFNVFL